MSLAKSLKSKGVKQLNKGPVWAGPESDADNGGITNSLLGLFLSCRERFRIRVVEGLKIAGGFNQRMEYGNLWHLAEENLAAIDSSKVGLIYKGAANCDWKPKVFSEIKKYAQALCKQYPLAQEQIQHWYQVCKVQFPLYVKYWASHKDVKQRTPVVQEHVFKVPYKLPSGRTVYLRGKWDSLDLIGPKGNQQYFLQENKAKGDIDAMRLVTQLRDDCQSMFYAVTVKYSSYLISNNNKIPFGGIRYNVARRPLSGGKDSIRQKQGETADEFYTRLGGLIADHPEYYFARWNVEVAASDITKFEQRFFIPIMEQLCDWWVYMQQCKYDPWNGDEVGLGYCLNPDTNDNCSYYTRIHWQTPHGLYNPLTETNSSELDEYIFQGSRLGLIKTDNLFPELQ